MKFLLLILIYCQSAYGLDEIAIEFISKGDCEGGLAGVYHHSEFFTSISMGEKCAVTYIDDKYDSIYPNGLIEIFGLLGDKKLKNIAVKVFSKVVHLIDKKQAKILIAQSAFNGMEVGVSTKYIQKNMMIMKK